MPTARTTKAAAATAEPADEAQTAIEGEVVEETPKATTLGMFQEAQKVTVTRIKAELQPQIDELKSTLANLEALATAEPAAPAIDATEIEAIVEGYTEKLRGQIGATVTRTELHEALNDFAKELGGKASAPRIASDASRPVEAVYQQVLDLMREVNELGKNGRASYGSGEGSANYSFRGVDDAMNAVGSAMRKVGLILKTEVIDASHTAYRVDKVNKGGQKWGETEWVTTRITMRYTFISPLDGSRHSMEGYGVGKDSGDKDGSKALAAAMKYALFQGLCIPVKGMNIDPETESADSGDVPEPDGYQQYDTSAEPPPEPVEEKPAEQPPVGDEARLARAKLILTVARSPKCTHQGHVSIGLTKAQQLKILDVEIEGASLQTQLLAIRHTLPPAPAQ